MTAYPSLGDWGGKKPNDAETTATGRAEALAWSLYLGLTAGRLTPVPVTVRPICQSCASHTWITAPVGMFPYSGDNYWFTLPADALIVYGIFGGDYGNDPGCGPSGHRMIKLERPVGTIVSVTVDGTPVDPGAYRVDDGNQLIRQDGGAWPTAQNLAVPVGSVGTFEVTYFRGYQPDDLDFWAIGTLAFEFYSSMTGKKSRLPERVTAVTRQGVTFQMPDILFEDGRTGIREVDAVVHRYNPHKLAAPTVITSPDKARRWPRTIGR